MPSIATVILPSKEPDLERAIYQLKAQTAQPSSIIVCANIDKTGDNDMTRVVGREDILLFAGYDKLRIRYDTFPGYYLLPRCLDTIRSDYLYISRDTDVLQPRALEFFSRKLSRDKHAVAAVSNMFLRTRRKTVPYGEPLGVLNTTFSNTMLSTQAVRASLDLWTPSGIVNNDYDLIALVLKHGNSISMRELLVESDPDSWGL